MERDYWCDARDIWLKNPYNRKRYERFEVWGGFKQLSNRAANEIYYLAEELRKEDVLIAEKKVELQCRLEESKENVSAWRKIGNMYDALDEAIENWQKTRDHDDFRINAWPHLRMLNRDLAVKYLIKIPRKYRRLNWDGTESFDHTEWLTIIMMGAIEQWKPEKLRHFRVFYEERVKWYYLTCIRDLNRQYLKDVDILLLDFSEEQSERMLKEAENYYYSSAEVERVFEGLMEHYGRNRRGQLFADGYVFEFLKILSEKQRSFYLTLFLDLNEKQMTNEQCAKHLGISMSTFQRKRENLRQAWIDYNRED